jgi:hypothetical protein
LKKLGILVDRDEEGYLLQIFTKPVEGPPYGLLRNSPAQRLQRLRQGKLQGAIRIDRGRTATPREPLAKRVSSPTVREGATMIRDYIEFQDRSTPLAYLITIRSYGTWLHGDERGSMDRREYNQYGDPAIAASH